MLIVTGGLILLGAAAVTPWRRLTTLERLWAALAGAATVAVFTVPVEPATSPVRHMSDRALAVLLILCAVLLVSGFVLMRSRRGAGRPARELAPMLVVAGLPLFTASLVSLLFLFAG